MGLVRRIVSRSSPSAALGVFLFVDLGRVPLSVSDTEFLTSPWSKISLAFCK
jgi:hypothetical protein